MQYHMLHRVSEHQLTVKSAELSLKNTQESLCVSPFFTTQ